MTTLQFNPPALLKLATPDGVTTVDIDVYEARRMLEDAGRKPSEAARMAFILDYIACKLGASRETLAESMALEFNDCIVQLVEALNEERKKKLKQTLCSLTATQESPATIASGP